ncbi:MAG: AMP-binding protein [Porticoccaceae bacterium]|jgi:fatty-acyl-CoA synthase|uniref:AMP-binding protein n=1 Tax=Neptunomonas phycophila TaxID=1572645 RepID=UPI003518FFC2
MVNISNSIHFHGIREPDRVALSYLGHSVTYYELWKRIQRVAAYLVEAGIEEDDVVAVLMKNSSAFIEIAFAVSYLGAVFLPINYRLATEEINYICNDSSAKLLFADIELYDEDISCNSVLLDTEAQINSSYLVSNCHPVAQRPRSTDDLFRLMYTSGTTSHPKGVMHTYGNFHWKCIDQSIALNLSSNNRLLIAGPLYHVGAFDLPGIGVLLRGGMLAIMREFDTTACLSLIQSEKLNCAWLAPVMTSSLLTFPENLDFDLTSINWIIGGGERTPEKRIHEFSSLFKNARYIDAYGLTESCGGDTFMDPGKEFEKIGSVGRPTPHVEVQIRDETGNILDPGVEGEICLRGPKIFDGYWQDPKKTQDSFYEDVFRTGDAGYLDSDGFLFLTDRIKDMIISGGENISSQEVERVIIEIPQISEVAVFGVKDQKWGEIPVAAIVSTDGKSIDLDSLKVHCKNNLASFKVPKDFVIKKALPRNPSGKVLKRLLRQEYSI